MSKKGGTRRKSMSKVLRKEGKKPQKTKSFKKKAEWSLTLHVFKNVLPNGLKRMPKAHRLTWSARFVEEPESSS